MWCHSCGKPIETYALMIPIFCNDMFREQCVPDHYAHYPKCPEGDSS